MIRRKSNNPNPICGTPEKINTWGEEKRLLLNSETTTATLRLWRELERWQQEDNEFIETGYRCASGSLSSCIRSLTYIHNETVNIYSHLIAACVFMIIPIFIFKTEIPPRYAIATRGDKTVCLIYFIGVAICFILSATYHTIMNHSKEIDNFGAQLDYQGVILLMWGAVIPLVYYGFSCEQTLQYFYWTVISLLAIACSISTFQPGFRETRLRPIRAATFGSLAIFTMIPVVHGIYKYGWSLQEQRMGITWVLKTLVLNTLGATAYALKIPERWSARRFDILGASHQVFHVTVVFAALMYTGGIIQSFDFYHAHGPGSCK